MEQKKMFPKETALNYAKNFELGLSGGLNYGGHTEYRDRFPKDSAKYYNTIQAQAKLTQLIKERHNSNPKFRSHREPTDATPPRMHEDNVHNESGSSNNYYSHSHYHNLPPHKARTELPTMKNPLSEAYHNNTLNNTSNQLNLLQNDFHNGNVMGDHSNLHQYKQQVPNKNNKNHNLPPQYPVHPPKIPYFNVGRGNNHFSYSFTPQPYSTKAHRMQFGNNVNHPVSGKHPHHNSLMEHGQRDSFRNINRNSELANPRHADYFKNPNGRKSVQEFNRNHWKNNREIHQNYVYDRNYGENKRPIQNYEKNQHEKQSRNKGNEGTQKLSYSFTDLPYERNSPDDKQNSKSIFVEDQGMENANSYYNVHVEGFGRRKNSRRGESSQISSLLKPSDFSKFYHNAHRTVMKPKSKVNMSYNDKSQLEFPEPNHVIQNSYSQKAQLNKHDYRNELEEKEAQNELNVHKHLREKLAANENKPKILNKEFRTAGSSTESK